jgi:hypothetical protein
LLAPAELNQRRLWLQRTAPACFQLLRAIVDALAEWSADVGKAIQQHQQTSGAQQTAQLHHAASALHESSIWLPAAADFLLLCMQHADLWSAADRRQLLDIVGQLLRQVL